MREEAREFKWTSGAQADRTYRPATALTLHVYSLTFTFTFSRFDALATCKLQAMPEESHVWCGNQAVIEWQSKRRDRVAIESQSKC